jgi:hypothetical protein
MSIADTTQISGTGTGPRADRKLLRLSAILLGGGFILFAVVNLFHPSGVDQNNHPAVFAQYAQSATWTPVHLGAFVGFAAVIAGLLVLFYALRLEGGMAELAVSVGSVSAGVALALTATRFAVDGVVLKRAVDAWVAAPDSEKAARFASAETVRWLEEATTSYQGFVLGFALILLAALIVWTGRAPKPAGYILGLSGAANLVAGWIVGASGLAPQGAIPTYVGQICWLIAAVWLLISAWRVPQSGQTAPRSGSPAARRNDPGAPARSQ